MSLLYITLLRAGSIALINVSLHHSRRFQSVTQGILLAHTPSPPSFLTYAIRPPIIKSNAPVAKRIRHRPPEPESQVRILPGVPAFFNKYPYPFFPTGTRYTGFCSSERPSTSATASSSKAPTGTELSPKASACKWTFSAACPTSMWT